MERWVNKVAVVTGASAGIGEACTRALLERGMIVVGLARRQTLMDNQFRASLPEGQRKRFHAMKCDLRLENDIRNAFAWIDENLGGVQLLVNDVGIVRHNVEIISETYTDVLKAGIDVNVKGVALCTREAFQSMRRQNFDGQIILLNSLCGNLNDPKDAEGSCHFHSSMKYAFTAMVEVLRHEFFQQQTKIKITSISPADYETKIIGDCAALAVGIRSPHFTHITDAILFCLQAPQNVQIREIFVDPLRSLF